MADRDADILYIKQRKVKQWTIILLFLLILTVAVRMRLTDVTVYGNDTYTAEEAENLIFSDYWDRNTVVCLFKNITGQKKDLPFVADYKVVIRGPFTCELRFYEKKPIGCIRYMSNYMYFDKDGIMIESSPRRLEGIPVVEGLQFGYVILGKKLPVSSSLLLNSIMSVTQQLSLFQIPCGSIRYNDAGNTVTAILDEGDIEVYLGSENDLAAKISALNDMLPEIREQQLKGTLDLSNYDDKAREFRSYFKLREENGTNGGTSVTEAEPDTEAENEAGGN